MNENVMDLNKFTELTGLEFTEEDEIRAFNRAVARADRTLERFLGWSPIYRQMYEEVAKVRTEGNCPTEQQLSDWMRNHNANDLFSEPKPAEGRIKLFPYYPEDANYFVDPCTAVYAVKIVKITSGDGQQFMTVTELEPEDWNQKPNNNFLINRAPVIQWLEICSTPNQLPCKCDDGKTCYMLAVDADWLRQLPEDLLYLLSDLCLWHLQNQPSLEPKQLINSESVDGHSVSYGNDMIKKSEQEVIEPWLDTLKYYIGPYSTIYINKLRLT